MPSNDAPQVRLDSWKEIAAYLRRGERTVKRWEENRGLPVHRVPGGKGSVYAFPSELDDWLRSERDDKSEPTVGASPLNQPSVEAPLHKSTEAVEARAQLFPVAAPTSPSRVSVWILVSLLVALSLGTTVYLRGPGFTLHSLAERNPSRVDASSEASDLQKAQARELYLRGRYEWNKRTPASLDRAVDLFTQALVRDPSFAKAYAGLADAYNLKREYAGMPDKEAYARAIAAAQKAIELDDSLAEAHRSLAFALTNGEWDFANGEKEFLRAIELNPNDPVSHLWYANSYQAFDRWDITLGEMDRAQKLDPGSSAILADKGNMLFNAGKTDEALQLLKQVERNDPQFLSPHRYLARLYFETRNYPAFLEESLTTADLSHDPVLRGHALAAKEGFSRDGERGLLHDLYAAQKISLQRSEIPPTAVALTCALLGKKDEMFSLIEQDFKNHDGYALWLVSVPSFVAYKDDPKYQALLAQLHRPSPPTIP